MRKNIIAILLLSIMLLTIYNVNVVAEEGNLLPACVVTSDGEKWGYINETGTFVIKPAYDFAQDFNDKGIAIVANGDNPYDSCTVHFINKSGKSLAGPFYSSIPEFQNGMAILKADGIGYVIVDELGKVVLKSNYELLKYSEGLVSYYDSNTKLYGFIDLTGKVVIPAKYNSVKGFSDGKSIIQTSAGKYSVINKTGKVLEALKYYDEYNTAEGFTPYSIESKDNYSYGYKKQDGTVAIAPKFRTASRFSDGYAIVAIDDGNYGLLYGLINTKGQYVIYPEYTFMNYLGHGLYAVSQNSMNYDWYAPKAIINNKGEKLTDFKYNSVSEFNGDYAVASETTTTFFINLKGNIVDTLPQLQGIGQMKFMGDIIKAELDGSLTYLKENGEIIWQKNDTIPFNNNLSVNKLKYRRDYLTYIEYPEVTGIENKAVQDGINTKLKKDFIGQYLVSKSENQNGENDDEYYESIDIGFSVTKNKDLLIIQKSGYVYPIGAAHGMPSQEYFYIDTKTGAFYELKDLFQTNSKYTEKLTSIVNSQIALNTRVSAISGEFQYDTTNVEVAKDQDFILGTDSIKIYYYPYEIACYAAGFPEFEIPYGQIIDIIDTKGAFWNSFDKKILNHKINVLSSVKDSTVKTIESLVSSYEKSIIEAINSNSFSKVEPYLLKNSNLYNSQKKLVPDLYKKNTKEKLIKYEIYAIDKNSNNNEYRVYVLEDIAIKYAGKDYVNKKYSWYYTVKVDNSGNYKLSDIYKW